ncbi:MAG: Limit dextrin alpha-1,6-maltotetraose-hydrolase (EC [Candidatus Burkholderia crenata]|nr:MAG: Limit dextrin alpha-1,6-maltotetraose-hydrolase (EC [Candidatus Burkholderia crenata]
MSFKGIDNASYYRLPKDKRYYINDTGTGNTLNLSHPRVLQMVTDSLCYWVTEMNVDGFRFDFATILGREPYGDEGGGFVDSCSQDPILSSVKLIAEPWDCGPGGYQVGGFPPGWAEWNDKFRDTVREFWKGEEGVAAELATRIIGSWDKFNHRGRCPWASVNFITAHDGFTLNDLVSYNEKHNEANGEDNNDGSSDNRSWNCGEEPTPEQWDDPLMRCFGLVIDGRAQATGIRRPASDATLLLVFNAHHDVVDLTLPEISDSDQWSCLIDTNAPIREELEDFDSGAVYQVTGRSLLLFALHARGGTKPIFQRLEESLTDEVEPEGGNAE